MSPLTLALAFGVQALQPFPVQGLHVGAPEESDLPRFNKFIRESMPKEGLNTLVLEIGWGFKSKSHPEIDGGSLTAGQLGEIAAACKDAKVRLIPLVNLFGHQSWAEANGALLKAYPEFDETPGKYPGNKDIYCRSYCPEHPKLHEVVFAYLNEVLEASGADALHVGLDEVFIIGDKDCPRCGGKDPADLFAAEVNRLHAFLKERGKEMWMWGDRFLPGKGTGLGEWEAATNGTEGAIAKVPKDIVICDWHYEKPEPTAAYFAMHGFRVVSCPWRKPEVALGQLGHQRLLRSANPTLASRAHGMMQTCWNGAGGFLDAWEGKPGVGAPSQEVVDCLRALGVAWRAEP